MRPWRLVRAVHRDAALTGYGARRFGGRWNSRGVACVYASESLEIALLESLVHVDLSQLPRDLLALELEVPDAAIDALAEPPPQDWDAPPPYAPAAQAIGDRWLREGSALALRVPASVLPQREPADQSGTPGHERGQDRRRGTAALAAPPNGVSRAAELARAPNSRVGAIASGRAQSAPKITDRLSRATPVFTNPRTRRRPSKPRASRRRDDQPKRWVIRFCLVLPRLARPIYVATMLLFVWPLLSDGAGR
jgi:RES domain-containing protein